MDFRRLFQELRRRRVFRVAAAYVVAAWVVIQVADVALEAFEVPEWGMRLIIIAAVLGLVIAVTLAWAFDVTADGVRRAQSAGEPAPPVGGGTDTGKGPRGRRALIGAAVVAVVVVGGTIALVAGGRGADASAESTRIAVLPFSYRGSPELAYLGEGVVDLLSAKLNGAGDLSTVEPNALLRAVSRDASLDVEGARELAGRFGAASFITGSIVEVGGRIEISASLHDADGRARTTQTLQTSEAELLDGLDRLTRDMLADRFGRSSAQMEQLAAMTTTSLPALKAFLSGEAAFRRGDARASQAAFRQATREDTTFALAYYRLSVAGSWFPRAEADFAEVDDAMDSAVRHDARLSEPQRQILAAYVQYRQGANDSAQRILRPLLRTRPQNAEAWYMLGEALFHGATRQERALHDAEEAFRRTLALDPRQTFAALHLGELAAEMRRPALLDSVRTRLAVDAPEQATLLEAHRWMLDGSPAGLDSLARWADGVDDETLMDGYWRAASTIPNAAAMRMLADRMLARDTDLSRGYGVAASLGLDVAQGRMDRARSGLQHVLRELDANLAATGAGLNHLFLMPFLPLDQATLRAGWEAIGAPDRVGARGALVYGVLSHRLGERAELDRARAHLREMDSPYWSNALEAHLAWMEDDAGRAVDHLDRIGRDLRAAEAVLRAEALSALGRDREALEWFTGVPGYNTEVAVTIAYLPVVHMRRAQILDALGEHDQAAAQYAAFLDWWRDADASLRPIVRESEERLARLRAR